MPLRMASVISLSSSIVGSLSLMALLSRAPRGRRVVERSDDGDVGRLRALVAGPRLERHASTLGEGLEPRARDARVVDEEVATAVLRADEAVALGVVEPLDGSVCHRT